MPGGMIDVDTSYFWKQILVGSTIRSCSRVRRILSERISEKYSWLRQLPNHEPRIARAKVRGDHFHFRIGKHPVFELVVEQLLLSAGVLETYNITSSKPGRRP
jgi:hypothetical protein